MEDTARNVLKNEILPEHTSKLDWMFDDKFATVKSRLESHFNEFGRKQGIFLTQSLSIIGAILSGISKPASTYEIFIIGRLFIGVACRLLTGATSVMYSGSIPWLITGELFTQAPRSAAIAVATFVNWSGNLAVGLIFPHMQEAITDFSFLPFTILLVILFALLYFYLPETKGIPVNEIEALLQTPNAWTTPIGRSNEMLLQEFRAAKNSYGATENVKN